MSVPFLIVTIIIAQYGKIRKKKTEIATTPNRLRLVLATIPVGT